MCLHWQPVRRSHDGSGVLTPLDRTLCSEQDGVLLSVCCTSPAKSEELEINAGTNLSECGCDNDD